MAVITQRDLIKMVSEKIDGKYPQDEIYWVLKGTFECFPDILTNGDTLRITDCFTMESKLVRGRTYSNFGRGEVHSEDHYEPCFKPYKKLREACLALPVGKKSKRKKRDKDEG